MRCIAACMVLQVLLLLPVAIEGFFFNKVASPLRKDVKVIKSELLELSRKVNRGLTETPEERGKILQLFEDLEKSNKLKATLKNPALNAVWSLEYTTSDSILGRKSLGKKIGPVLQMINANTLMGQNSEVVQYFGFINVPRKVTAALTPMTPSKVAVQFIRFTLGPISFKAPASAKGELDITYLDEDLRLSRGDKGSIFVLTRYSDLPAK